MCPFLTISNSPGKIIWVTCTSRPIVLWPLAKKFKAAFVIGQLLFLLMRLTIFKPPFWQRSLISVTFCCEKALFQTVSTTIITWQWHEVLLVYELAREQFLQSLESTAASEPRRRRGKYCEGERSRDGSTAQSWKPFCGGFPVESKDIFCWNTIKCKTNAKTGALKNERKPF